MESARPIDAGWTFSPGGQGPAESVTFPHHWDLVGHRGLERGVYRTEIDLGVVPEGRRPVLALEGVDYRFRLAVDGREAAVGGCPFLVHEVELGGAPGGGPRRLELEVSRGVERVGAFGRLLYRALECPVHLSKRHVKGVHGNWDCKIIDLETSGIWSAPVLRFPGAVEIRDAHLVTCALEKGLARCEVHGRLRLRGEPADATVRCRLVDPEGRMPGAGVRLFLPDREREARFRVPLDVPEPALWWTWDQGEPVVLRLEVEAETRYGTDRRVFPAGIRHFDAPVLRRGSRHLSDLFDYLNLFVGLGYGRPGLHARRPGFRLNGRPIHLRGADYTPPIPAGRAGPEEMDADVAIAREANLNYLRVHGTAGARPLYEACDRLGLLIQQDMPLQWGYRIRGETRRIALAVARETTRRLAPHPSVAIYVAHNEPTPSNFFFLDGALRRAMRREDRSRPVIRGSGYPGADAHIYPGWYIGKVSWFRRARFAFVSEFGAQAAPDLASVPDLGAAATRWPLDRALWRNHCLQFGYMGRWLPPVDSLASFVARSQEYQAVLLSIGVEHFRRMRAPGVAAFMLAAVQPAVTWDVVDHRRRRKLGFQALRDAMAPLLVSFPRYQVYYRGGEVLEDHVWLVNDAPREARGRLTWTFLGPDEVHLDGGEAPFAVAAGGIARGPRIGLRLPDPSAHGRQVGRYVLRLVLAGPEGDVLARNEAWFVLLRPDERIGAGLPGD